MRTNVCVFYAMLILSSCFLVSSAIAAIPQHQGIDEWQGTATCLECHGTEAAEVHGSVHYQWLGSTPYMADGPEFQGKLDVGVNSYCINITGNWDGCKSCHAGLGLRPEPAASSEQLENLDCLICHQEAYKRKSVNGTFVPDTENMAISMVEAAQTVHEPNRVTCLQCHAKGGGGDNYKRGDLTLAHGTTADRSFDVHMATTGADLSCQECHHTQNHLMAGRGSDLRPTDLDEPMTCVECHPGKLTAGGHQSSAVDRHVSRLACQTCHIDRFARNADDTDSNEETEMDRDWQLPHLTPSGAIHPTPTMVGNLIPEYRWWNGRSESYLLYDDALISPASGRIPTSEPLGGVQGQAKLYPFKYKTATQPLLISSNQLIALDTSVYFSSGDPVGATRSGLVNMGYSPDLQYSWVETETFQLITHEVAPSSEALRCNDCHNGAERMDMTGASGLGYDLRESRNTLCVKCHKREDGEDGAEYLWVHNEHVRGESYDCSWCHNFSRPERNLLLSPVYAALTNVINSLRILTGAAIDSSDIDDINGDDRVGAEETIHYLNQASMD